MARTIAVEWSADALRDLDRFAIFLHQNHPSLASIVAREIVLRSQVLSEVPLMGRPIEDARNIGRSCLRS